MSLLKDFISLFPGGARLAQRYSFARRSRMLAHVGNAEDRFTRIYKNNDWKNPESRSGKGSTLRDTENIRRELPGLLRHLQVGTILDAPCGDYNWFKLVERGEVQYVGCDIVRPLVDNNQLQFGDDTTRFGHLDIVTDPLPEADLWLCRDCLMHLSTSDVCAALDNFRASNIQFLLATTHWACHENIDIPTGHFRELNLEIEPFDLPEPILRIQDSVEGSIRDLALWRRDQLLR